MKIFIIFNKYIIIIKTYYFVIIPGHYDGTQQTCQNSMKKVFKLTLVSIRNAFFIIDNKKKH